METNSVESFGKKQWVFILEDDDGIRDILTKHLKKASYNVVSSATVSDANMKLKNQVFDCILLDLRIHKETTEKLVEYLRTEESLNQFSPVMMVSGSLDKEVLLKLKPKIQGAVVKPFDMNNLLSKIAALVK